ncbi:MAG: ImmA/IrrE family metallo-endopeptidase [Tyzzerella sp.]|nr:ImmA/IrrE family metallo-endopeptidase [Tyzzerella sp.]
MTIERFRNIVKYNIDHQSWMEERARQFREKLGIIQERNLSNLLLLSKSALDKENYRVFEMPFSDTEIGAVSYKKVNGGYIILNSSLAKVNMNFALAHEFYHIFYQKKAHGRRMELYMSEKYGDYEEEHEANLFAGILMMPKFVFQYMIARFSMEQTPEDTELTLLAKLMSYFEVPYMAVLIRCYELNLLQDREILEQLLNVDKERIQEEFSRLWLKEQMLRPSYNDEFPRFKELVSRIGKRNIEEGLMTRQAVKKVLSNMDEVYQIIKGDLHDDK